ncbi:MAG: HEPN domain-containing protein [Acidobacteriota bacterium]|nr:HEPN domain-containing protein [Acidobacteriota bacterium]
MKPVEVHRFEQRLNALFQKASTLSDDLELQAHFARYLCVLVSGYLETAIAEVYSHYARDKGHPHLATYINRQMNRFQNPNMTKVLNLVRDFNPIWADQIQALTQGEIRDSVDSVVADRHKIAHGESVGVSLAYARQYYSGAVQLVELIIKQCDS